MMPRMIRTLLILPLVLHAASGYTDANMSPAPILVEADEFHVDLQTEQAIWQGNVEATQGRTTFRAGSLTLHLEQLKTQPGTPGVAHHSDTHQKNAYQLSADRVSYDLEAGQISGSGNSELRRGFELIRAEDIVYQVDQQRVQARPAANGRVQVQFLSIPGQSLFPLGAAD